MLAIQSGANWWVDGTTQFPGGGFARNIKGGAMNNTAVQISTGDNDDSLDSMISDVEEEGEITEPQEETGSHQTIRDTLSDEIAAGLDEMSASDELVAAVAKHLEIIEAAMRQHQTAGGQQFHDEQADTDQNPTDDSFNDALLGDVKQNPSAAFAATIPGQNRLGLLSLLSN